MSNLNWTELARRAGILACVLAAVALAFIPSGYTRYGSPHHNIPAILVALVFLVILLRIRAQPLRHLQDRLSRK